MKSSAEPKSPLGVDAPIPTMLDEETVLVSPDAQGIEKRGTVLRMERSSIHDGDGFRTVVFLKGCPLRCAWCSTPESQSAAIERIGDKTYGEGMSVEQLMAVVRKDSIFYFHSGGGLTISGGEPLVQADFCASLLRQAQYEGINTAMETSLWGPPGKVEKVLPYLDVLYADLKHIDPESHKKFCGTDIAPILDNMRLVDARAGDLRFIIRIPLVPGINDDPETLHAMGAFCGGLKNLHCVQLLPYHRLGVDTYRKMGLDYPLADVKSPSQEHMDTCRNIVGSHVGGGVC